MDASRRTFDGAQEKMKEFFVGLHHPADTQHVQPSFISINALRNRRSGIPAGRWVLDSGAFHRTFNSWQAPDEREWICRPNLLLEAVRNASGGSDAGLYV